MEEEKLRIDKYLWAIRIFKTRSLASEACGKGRVKMNGEPAKASKPVHIGDEYEIRTETGRQVIRVAGLLYKRMAYKEAIKYYTDITPAAEIPAVQFQASSFHTGKRLSKVGRPTKKDRRNLDDFTGS